MGGKYFHPCKTKCFTLKNILNYFFPTKQRKMSNIETNGALRVRNWWLRVIAMKEEDCKQKWRVCIMKQGSTTWFLVDRMVARLILYLYYSMDGSSLLIFSTIYYLRSIDMSVFPALKISFVRVFVSFLDGPNLSVITWDILFLQRENFFYGSAMNIYLRC